MFQHDGLLWAASLNGHLNELKTLLSEGANVNVVYKVGKT